MVEGRIYSHTACNTRHTYDVLYSKLLVHNRTISNRVLIESMSFGRGTVLEIFPEFSFTRSVIRSMAHAVTHRIAV